MTCPSYATWRGHGETRTRMRMRMGIVRVLRVKFEIMENIENRENMETRG